MYKPVTLYSFHCLLLMLAAILLFSACQSSKKKTSENVDSTAYIPTSAILKQLTDSIQQSPDSAKFYLERGKILIQTKDYKNAEKDIRKAISLKPLASNYYTELGLLYLAENFIDSAYKYFSIALQINPENRIARLQQSFVFWIKDSLDAVLSQTDTLLSRYPQSSKALGLRSQVFETMGDTNKALVAMRKAIKIPPARYNAIMRMGDLLMNRSLKEAMSFYKKASKLDTNAAEPYYCMGLIEEKQGDISQAKVYYKKSISLQAQFVLTYLHLGKLYENENNWEKAKKMYILATKVDPTNSDAYYKKGRAEERLGEKDAAIADYRQALVFDEDNEKAEAALEAVGSRQ